MHGKAILYVEDDENDVLLMQHVVGQVGLPAPLQIVTNGIDARDYLSGAGRYQDRQAHLLPSLVLLDWKLPGLSGFEVLCWLRAQTAYQTVPVVVFSCSGQECDIELAYASGADAYIVKPGGLERLRRIAQGLNEFLRSPNPQLSMLPGIKPKRSRGQQPVVTPASPKRILAASAPASSFNRATYPAPAPSSSERGGGAELPE